MTYREIRNTIWKYPLIAIAVVIALSLVMGLFWFFKTDKVYSTRLECQNAEDCECEPTNKGADNATYSETWECVRPLPNACIFNTSPDQKSIMSIKFFSQEGNDSSSIIFDLCEGKKIVNVGEPIDLEAEAINDIVRALNENDFLHMRDKAFLDPDYQGQLYVVAVDYKASDSDITLDSFTRTASCSTSCSADLMKIINLLKNIN
jgi:hypothetical protein